MAVVLNGGKTSPRICKDFQFYNPRNLPPNGDNILTRLPEIYDDAKNSPARYKRDACRHDWALKDLQSSLPEQGKSFDPNARYTIAICCRRCRTHAALTSEPGSGWSCQRFHHFRHVAQISQGLVIANGDNQPEWHDHQEFKCTQGACGAALSVKVHGPQFSEEHIRVLTDREVIKARFEGEKKARPATLEGLPVPLPLNIMNNLRTYLTDAKKSSVPRRIPAENKYWLQCLGDGCESVLAFLGFRREDGFWIPPRPQNLDPQFVNPDSDADNAFLEDIVTEINILMALQPESELRKKQLTLNLPLGQVELEKCLGARDYDKTTSARTQAAIAYDEEHPYYAMLGVVQDMHDEVILNAYRMQVDCDRDNQPHYFDAFRGIAHGREKLTGVMSEMFSTEIALEISKGVVGMKEILEAYRQLGVPLQDSAQYEDERLIGMFKARVPDAPMQEQELRVALTIVGNHRNSKRIQDFVENSITTYEQALSYLGADENSPDDFIITLFHLKTQDHPHEKEKANGAVEIVGKHRNSSALMTFGATGQASGETTISVQQAYVRLNCTENVDDQSILAAHDLAASDAPSQRPELARNLAVIARYRNSQALRARIPANMTEEGDRDPTDWPVGLENLGNTCYLNSMLQCYFSISAFRDFVRSSEEFLKPRDPELIRKFTVGQRHIELAEVVESQKFLSELKGLFEGMVTSAEKSVRPRQELVVATLAPKDQGTRRDADEKAIEAVQRRSSVANSPQLARLQPTAARQEETVVEEDAVSVSSTEAIPDIARDGVDAPMARSSSEDTLVDGNVLDAAKEKMITDTDVEMDPPQLPPSPADDLPALVSSDDIEPFPSIEDADVAPERPPPLPPASDKELYEEKVKSYLMQQDVSEVISNVLFRLSCAIVGRDDSPGEQEDQMKDLFWGMEITTTESPTSASRAEPLPFNVISVNVAEKLEDALEVAFGVNEIEGSDKTQYRAITRIPPILQIEIIRAQQTHKDETNVRLPLELYMDRFMDDADAQLKKTRLQASLSTIRKNQAETRKRELTAPTTNLELDGPKLLETATEYVKATGDETDLVDGLNDMAGKEKHEYESLTEENIKKLADKEGFAKKQVNEDDPKSKTYLLHSVFVHRGSSYSGHYWIYIRDFKHNVWRVYNDNYVDIVPETRLDEIFNVTGSGFANDSRKSTPYLMTYVDASRVEELVEPLYRQVPAPGLAIDKDTSMGGIGEFANVEVLEGQDIVPRALQAHGNENR